MPETIGLAEGVSYLEKGKQLRHTPPTKRCITVLFTRLDPYPIISGTPATERNSFGGMGLVNMENVRFLKPEVSDQNFKVCELFYGK